MSQQTQTFAIEDDPAVVQWLRDGLERDGYTVVWHNNGTVGVACAGEHLPSLESPHCMQANTLKAAMPNAEAAVKQALSGRKPHRREFVQERT